MREPLIGARGSLTLLVSAWIAFGAWVTGLGFASREGGVRVGDAVLSTTLEPTALVTQALILGAIFVLGHLVLRRAAPGSDPILYAVVCLLSGIGWLYLGALAPDLAAHQGKLGLAGLPANQHASILAGVVVCVGAAALGRAGLLKKLARYRYLMALLYLALIAVTVVFGHSRARGAIVLTVGGVDIQSIEIAKYLLMFFAAGYLAEESEWLRVGRRLNARLVLPYLLLVGVALAPIALGLKEVGPTLLIGLAVLTLLYAGTRSATLVGSIAGAVLLVGTLAYQLNTPSVVRQRVDAFRDPFDHVVQIAHGLWAMAAGGTAGVGLTRAATHRIPIAESDFAFAGWVEATGFAGGAALLFLYALLCWRGVQVARRADDRFEAGLALGITAVIAAQVVMIVAGNMAFAPLTGITVPWVSHGRISLLTNFAAAGALLAISSRGSEMASHPWQVSLRTIGLAWLVLFLALGYGLFQRTVVASETLATTDFVNQDRWARLKAQVADGKVVLDRHVPVVAASVGPGRTQTELLRQIDAGAIHANSGTLAVDASCCRIRNPRRSAAAPTVTRGRILDAAGRPLAQSVPVPGSRRHARVYPYGAALFPVTGLASPLLVDRTGAEVLFDDVLAGDAEGSPRRSVQRLVSTSDAGDDVQLTVDAGLSQHAWRLLGLAGDGLGTTSTGRGAAVVLEGRSGEVLASVSRPAWDPNTWTIEDTDDGERWTQSLDRDGWMAAGTDREQMLRLSRATEVRYPPGSTFKIVLGASWLEEGKDPEERVTCRGRTPADAKRHLPGCRRHTTHPEPDLGQALAVSCNAWFGHAGITLGAAVLDLADAWGLNRGWDLAGGLLGRAWPTLSSKAWTTADGDLWDARYFRQNPRPAARSAIGQDTVESTPLQVALLAAAVANGGELVAPRLVSSVRVAPDPSRPEALGGVWGQATAEPPVRVTSRGNAKTLGEGLQLVMTEGTGHKLPRVVRMADGHHRLVAPADVPNLDPAAEVLPVAGKSGTADVCRNCGLDPHAWFVAWAPADARPEDAKVVVATFVENGGSGNAGAAAMELLAAGLNQQAARGIDPVPVDLRRTAP